MSKNSELLHQFSTCDLKKKTAQTIQHAYFIQLAVKYALQEIALEPCDAEGAAINTVLWYL